jgi:hypothetical protein
LPVSRFYGSLHLYTVVSSAEAAATPIEKDAASKITPLAMFDKQSPIVDCSHVPPAQFMRGQSVSVALTCSQAVAVRLHDRHVNQAETYRTQVRVFYPMVPIRQ